MVSRRTIIAAVGAGAVGSLWHVRAIQVAAFAAAASVGRSRRRPTIGPAERAAEWAKASFPVLPGRAPSPATCVTYHPDYHAFDPPKVLKSLVAARQLGVGWIRTDIRWNYLVPDGYHADVGAVAWYGDFLGAIRKCLLKSLVVLSTPPPGVLRQQPAEKLDSWSRFVEIVARDLGARCDAFQLMNEVNNPLYGFLPLQETATALERGAAIVRAKLPAARIAINVSTDLWGWQDYLERLLDLSARAVDIVGLDHYPRTWTVGIHERWSKIIDLARAIAAAPLGSPWHGRHLAIMETGFSTNFLGRGEISQAEYFEGIVKVAQKLKDANGGDDPFLGIYELCDEDSQSWLDPEAHFGLLTSDLRPKRAFQTVADAVELL